MKGLRRESISGLTIKHRQENLAWRKAQLERRGWSLEKVQNDDYTLAIFQRHRKLTFSDFLSEATEWAANAIPIVVGLLALIVASIFFVFARIILLVVLLGIAIRILTKIGGRRQ